MWLFPKELRDQESLYQVARKFEKTLEDNQKIADPADRVAADLNLSRAVEAHADTLGSKLAARSHALAGAFYVTSAMGGPLAGLAIATLCPPAGIALFLGGLVLGLTALATNFIPNRLGDIFFREQNGHLEALQAVETKAGQAADLTLKTKTAEIAASPKFDGLYDRYPEIRDRFVKAFTKAAARQEIPAVVPQATPKPGLVL